MDPMMPSIDKTEPVDPVELEAVRIALNGSTWERLRWSSSHLLALLGNPNDTRQVFYFGMVLSAPAFPRFLARFLSQGDGLWLLKEQPGISSASVDYAALRALPADTFGGAYVRFLDANALDPDMFQPPPAALPEVARYVSQRMRQVHDLWHVLTGYTTDVRGEVALQAFTWAQTRMPASGFIAFGGVLKFGRKDPQLLALARQGYRMGQQAKFLPPLYLERYFERPLSDVRRELGIVAAPSATAN